MIMFCKDCKNFSYVWERDDRVKDDPEWMTKGECSLVEFDYSKNTDVMIVEDGCVFVGIDFGCIKFKNK